MKQYSLSKLFLNIGLIYLLIIFNEGAIRYLLAYISHYLIYIKDLILIIPIVYVLLLRKVPKKLLYFVILLIISFLTALIYTGSLFQIAFFLRVLLPGIYIILTWKYLKYIRFEDLKIKIYSLLAISIVGILLDMQYQMPWVGMTYEAGGYNVQVGRDWTTFGIERLSGFARSSFNAAQAILLCSLPILLFSKKGKILIGVISFLFISLTTTKGIIASYIVLVLFILFKKNKGITNTIYMTVLLSSILLPVIILVYGTDILKFGQDPNLLSIIFDSLFTRFEEIWPDAIELIHEQGNFIFGRGLGGIGTAMKIGESQFYNPADNLIIYLYATFGLLGLAMFYYVLIKKLFMTSTFAIQSLVVVILTYGLTTGIIEGFFLILLAIIISHNNSNQNNRNLSYFSKLYVIDSNK